MAFVQSVAELLVWLFDNGFEDCEKVTFEGFLVHPKVSVPTDSIRLFRVGLLRGCVF